MYQAELRGKLPSDTEAMEDILTSNVFSFFKYSKRNVFLKQYLNGLGFSVTSEESKEAKFIFWPRYTDNTEPDLVIIVGKFYLLIEAKYFSDFAGETVKTKAQLLREIDGGRLDAQSYDKDFHLIAITADYYKKADKFQVVPVDSLSRLIWTNWQNISALLYKILRIDKDIEKSEKEFAQDLYDLLDKKSLRNFIGITNVLNSRIPLRYYNQVFFDAKTAEYRGDFIGFEESLSFDKSLTLLKASIFLKQHGEIFTSLLHQKRLTHPNTYIFYKED